MKNLIKEGILVIIPEGNLLSDAAKEPVLELLKDNLAAGNKKVLFNLSELKFMNSSGLDLLLMSAAKIKHAGGELALCNVPIHTHKLLQITRLENIMHEQKDESSALAFLKSSQTNKNIKPIS